MFGAAELCIKLSIVFMQLLYLDASPIQFKIDESELANVFIPKDFCILPPDLGTQGKTKYIEECESLDRFKTLPLPGQAYQRVGTHALVCCPKKIYDDDICFPTDAWCPIYRKKEYTITDEDGGIQAITPAQVVGPVVMANRTCYNTPLGNGMVLSNCVPINRCKQLLDLGGASAPISVMQPCGFDEKEPNLMICCPEELTTDSEDMAQKPRFPVDNEPGGEARQCTDKVGQCDHWKNNDGCALDRSFEISKADGNGLVQSADMFNFMQSACLESCGWCGSKGCVDEHPLCKEWARNAYCVHNPLVMAHMCRESCGVCGFLSTDNNEEQVKDGNSYTDFTKDTFDCGRYKLLNQINGTNAFLSENDKLNEEEGGSESEPLTEEEVSVDDIDLRTSDEVFLSTDPVPENDYFCGATMVSDRWVVAASHCYDDFGASATATVQKVRINTIRDNTPSKELVEIKRVFKHPLYKYPNLYNDVAVLELGRRVEYDWDVYGDTPSCLDGGLDLVGKIGTIQGYGLTEDGTRGKLLEANVTVISNDECARTLDYNTTSNRVAAKQIEQALPQGLNYGLICAKGEKNDKGVVKGSCKGDSGGPLTTKDKKQRTTLVGIVSGGIGCGKGYPGWYTKVAFQYKWIQCIIETSKTVKIKKEIDKACAEVTVKPKTCQQLDDDDLIFGDLRSVEEKEEEECNDDGTFKSVEKQKYQPLSDFDLRSIFDP